MRDDKNLTILALQVRIKYNARIGYLRDSGPRLAASGHISSDIK